MGEITKRQEILKASRVRKDVESHYPLRLEGKMVHKREKNKYVEN